MTFRSRSFGPVRMGRPHGVAAVVAVLASITYVLSGGRSGQVPFALPFGITKGMLGLATIALFVLLFVLQLFRGEVTSSEESPTTLDLNK
jgi:hypothetical protein